MHSILLAVAATGMASFANAFTKPTDNTWGPLLTPDLTHPVTQGQTAQITWDPENHPTEGVTVSIVLCHGPSTNCQTSDTAIVEGVPASQKSYSWSVPSDLAPGTMNTDTGYGLLIIVDGTGEFQYSTQFSCLEGKGGSSGSSSTTSSGKPSGPTTTKSGSSSSSSILLGPPAQQTGSWTTAGSLNGTHTTYSVSWISTATSVPSGSATGWASTLGASTLTSLVSAPSTTVFPTASNTATGAGVSASTFPGAADRLSLNVAGFAVAGVAAFFAL